MRLRLCRLGAIALRLSSLAGSMSGLIMLPGAAAWQYRERYQMYQHLQLFQPIWRERRGDLTA